MKKEVKAEKKLNKSIDENVVTVKIENKTPKKKLKTKDVDPVEKKRRVENYQSFMNRGGPDAPGSKDIPDGAPNCLKNLTFVMSGILESLDRDECKALIEKYGGRVTGSISGKTNFLLIGRDGGEAKQEKARELKVKIISEDDLLQMIATRPGDEETPKKPLISPSKVRPPASPVKAKPPPTTTSTTEVDKAKHVLATPPPAPKSIDLSPTIEKQSVDEANLMCKVFQFV